MLKEESKKNRKLCECSDQGTCTFCLLRNKEIKSLICGMTSVHSDREDTWMKRTGVASHDPPTELLSYTFICHLKHNLLQRCFQRILYVVIYCRTVSKVMNCFNGLWHLCDMCFLSRLTLCSECNTQVTDNYITAIYCNSQGIKHNTKESTATSFCI